VAGALILVMGTLYGWRWAELHRRPWRLASVTKLADRTWELDIQPATGTPELAYDAGQFVWMTEGAGGSRSSTTRSPSATAPRARA
jgi:NAD(P)H-flavin reductase